MSSATTTTIPDSHSQTCATFRAAACTAHRTGRGTGLFRRLRRSVPRACWPYNGASVRSEGRPGRNENRFADVAAAFIGRQVARYIERANIAGGDQPILWHEPRRLLVQMVSSDIGNLGVDRSHALLVAWPPCFNQRALVLAVMPQVPVEKKRRERLQAEIDADLSGTAVSVFLDFALQAEIPAPASAGGKAPGLDLAFDRAAQSDAITPPKVGDSIAVDLDGAPPRTAPSRALSLRATWAVCRVHRGSIRTACTPPAPCRCASRAVSRCRS
jgi:hypothetical protein